MPPAVLKTIIDSNVTVKRCFFDALRSSEISKPIEVRTTFQLSSSGRASNLRINNGSLSGGTLERCLDAAFSKMSFPPSDGSGPVNYPFKLQ